MELLGNWLERRGGCLDFLAVNEMTEELKDLTFKHVEKTESDFNEYVMERDQFNLMNLSNLAIHAFKPTTEQIEWLDWQLRAYVRTIKPRRLLPGVSRVGREVYELLRNNFGFGCVYQILISGFMPRSIELILSTDMVLGMIASGTQEQRWIYKSATDSLLKTNASDTRINMLQEEINRVIATKEFRDTNEAIKKLVGMLP